MKINPRLLISLFVFLGTRIGVDAGKVMTVGAQSGVDAGKSRTDGF